MRGKAETLRAALIGLNLLLLAGVLLVGWDLTRARESELEPFDALKFALTEQTGSAKDRSVIWRQLDVPKPKVQVNPKTVIAATPAPSGCPWTLALVLLDEERPEAGSVILKDGRGNQTAVGVGKHVDPAVKAFRLESIRIESLDAHVHAIATLLRVKDEQTFELRISREVPKAVPDN